MFQRRHFEFLAQFITDLRTEEGSKSYSAQEVGRRLALKLEGTNHRFSKQTFLLACGLERDVVKNFLEAVDG